MRYAIFGLILLGVIGLLFNTGRQLYFWLKSFAKGLSPLVFGLLFSVFAAALIGVYILSRIPDSKVPALIFRIDHYALGLLAYLIIIFNITGLLLLLGRTVRLIPQSKLPAAHRFTGSAAMLLVLVLFVYGTFHALTIRTARYEIKLSARPGMTAQESPLRIALISDLHLGHMIGEKHLSKVVTAVQTAKPDLVVIAGDIFDGDMTALKNPERQQELFRELGRHTRYGVYASLGNHDAGSTYDQMLTFLANADVHVLLDQSAVIDQRLILLGRRDSSPIGAHGSDRQSLPELSQSHDLPLIVLDHQPGNLAEYGSNVDLILSGHTHRGQIFPFNLITSAVYTVDYGYYRASSDSPQIVVSSGAGTWGPPQRVASDNEIALIDIIFD